MTVKFAQSSDIQNILDFERHEVSNSSKEAFWDRSIWEKAIADQNILLSFDSDNNVDGFLRFSKSDTAVNVLYIHSSKEKRRQGIGKALLNRAVDIADQEGLATTLSVSPSNENAMGLYAHFGFAVDNVRQETNEYPELSTPMIRAPQNRHEI